MDWLRLLRDRGVDNLFGNHPILCIIYNRNSNDISSHFIYQLQAKSKHYHRFILPRSLSNRPDPGHRGDTSSRFQSLALGSAAYSDTPDTICE